MRRRAVLGVLLATPYLACSSSKPPVAVAPLPSVKSSASAHAPPSHEAQSLQGALDPSQFLAAVEVVTSDGLAEDELEILAPSYTGSSFGELTARKLLVGPTAGGKLRVRNAPGYPAPTQPVESRDRRCSFVVDCDELVVRGLIADLRGSSSTIAADDVVTYVYRFIEHKHMARGFDVASIVAEKREGDCTEHAVLTAALLRGTGFPAHVVLGLALVRIDDQWRAFGHAWTEYHDGERWQLADATNVGDAAEKIRYVPVRVMKDEGPGYGRASLEAFDIVDVRTLVVSTRLEP